MNEKQGTDQPTVATGTSSSGGGSKKLIITILVILCIALIALLLFFLLQQPVPVEEEEDYGRKLPGPILTPELDSLEDIDQYTEGKPVPSPIISGKTDPWIFMYYNAPEEHIRGDPTTPIVLIEYADMRSRLAGIIQDTLKQFIEDNKDKVHWAYRHYPFGGEDKDYLPGQASECIFLQLGDDAFWEFVDRMYKERNPSIDKLYSLADEIGVDNSEFRNCMESNRTYNFVLEDKQRATVYEGIQVTPSFTFYNPETGEMRIIDGINAPKYFQAVLDAMLQELD